MWSFRCIYIVSIDHGSETLSMRGPLSSRRCQWRTSTSLPLTGNRSRKPTGKTAASFESRGDPPLRRRLRCHKFSGRVASVVGKSASSCHSGENRRRAASTCPYGRCTGPSGSGFRDVSTVVLVSGCGCGFPRSDAADLRVLLGGKSHFPRARSRRVVLFWDGAIWRVRCAVLNCFESGLMSVFCNVNMRMKIDTFLLLLLRF